MDENELSFQIIGAAIEVHRCLGPGLLESTYEACLAFELQERGIACERQVALPVVYKGNRIEAGYRIDLFVENKVIVELKAVDSMIKLFDAQLITYLKLTGCKLGLLLNFNVEQMRRGGINRIALNL